MVSNSIDWDSTDVMESYDEENYKEKIKEMKQDLNDAKEYKNYCRCYKIFEKIDDVMELS